MDTRKKDREKLLAFIQVSLLLAIELIVCFTPLGTLPAIGSLNATLSHIPVIITALTLGYKAGAFMGFVFGACSFIYWSFVNPGIFSFIYTPLYSAGMFKGNFFSILICFIPRILIGLVCAGVYALLRKAGAKEIPASFAAGVFGSITNTVLVLSGIFIFFGEEYLSLASDGGKALAAILGMTVLTNGIPEAVLGGFAGAGIAVPVRKYMAKH